MPTNPLNEALLGWNADGIKLSSSGMPWREAQKFKPSSSTSFSLTNYHRQSPTTQMAHSDTLPFSALNFADVITSMKTYLCPVCLKESKDKEDFRRHYMTHTGEKPFHCPYCPYRACHKSNLTKHVRVVHIAKELSISKF